MGSSSTSIYTSELILCSTICVPSATRHNIHMYPYFLFTAIHHLKSSPTFSVRLCSSVGRVTVFLIRRSWVRFPLRKGALEYARTHKTKEISSKTAKPQTKSAKSENHTQNPIQWRQERHTEQTTLTLISSKYL